MTPNSDFIITFLLPTCEPDEMFKWLQPTLYRLKPIRDFIRFAICFQPPYTEEEIKKVLDTLDENEIEYKYLIKDYHVVRPYTPLIRMRNDCAMLYPDSDAYALLDDDMSFTSDSIVDYYIKAKNKMVLDPNLAVIALSDYERQYENIFATNNGIIYRGGKYYGFEGLMPHKLTEFGDIRTIKPYEGEDLLDLFGGFQDKFCAMVRLAVFGSRSSQLWPVPTNHVENRKVRGAEGHGWEDAKFQEGSIAKFIQKYFNPYFTLTMTMTLFDYDLLLELYPDYLEHKCHNVIDYPREYDW